MIQIGVWTPELAYGVGLLVTDGCLSNDGRHLDFTSKDLEQIENFKSIFGLTNKVGTKKSGYIDKLYYRVQFGDVKLYRWLVSIGISPQKTKSIGPIDIPDRYFFDFLRGHLDGDGFTYSYYDPRWRSSFMLYTTFVSASEKHIDWLFGKIEELLKIKGKKRFNISTYQIRYAKIDSLKLLKAMYYNESCVCLSRKRTKVENALQHV